MKLTLEELEEATGINDIDILRIAIERGGRHGCVRSVTYDATIETYSVSLYDDESDITAEMLIEDAYAYTYTLRFTF
jgi:hypothetical protein